MSGLLTAASTPSPARETRSNLMLKNVGPGDPHLPASPPRADGLTPYPGSQCVSAQPWYSFSHFDTGNPLHPVRAGHTHGVATSV